MSCIHKNNFEIKMTTQILSITDVEYLVDTFYAKVREDELLSPIFNNVIKENRPEQLEKIHRFWQTILLEEHTYFGSPREKAEEAKWRAQKMAQMFQMKIEMYKNSNSRPLI